MTDKEVIDLMHQIREDMKNLEIDVSSLPESIQAGLKFVASPDFDSAIFIMQNFSKRSRPRWGHNFWR